jgi:hypothetical protein
MIGAPSMIAWRSEPGPESFVFVTTEVDAKPLTTEVIMSRNARELFTR